MTTLQPFQYKFKKNEKTFYIDGDVVTSDMVSDSFKDLSERAKLIWDNHKNTM